MFALRWIVVDEHGHWLWNHTMSRASGRPTLTLHTLKQRPANLVWELLVGKALPAGFSPRRDPGLCTHPRCIDLRHYFLSTQPPGRRAGKAGTPWNGTLPHLFELGWIHIQDEHWLWRHSLRHDGKPFLAWRAATLNPARLLWELIRGETLAPEWTVERDEARCAQPRCISVEHHRPVSRVPLERALPHGRALTEEPSVMPTIVLPERVLLVQLKRLRPKAPHLEPTVRPGLSEIARRARSAVPIARPADRGGEVIPRSDRVIALAVLVAPVPQVTKQKATLETRWNGTLAHLFALRWICIERGHWVWQRSVRKSNGSPVTAVPGRRGQWDAARVIFDAAENPPIPKGFVLRRNRARCQVSRCVHPAHHEVSRRGNGAALMAKARQAARDHAASISIEKRLWERVRKRIRPEDDTGCWSWQGTLYKGQATLRYDVKYERAPRALPELEIPGCPSVSVEASARGDRPSSSTSAHLQRMLRSPNVCQSRSREQRLTPGPRAHRVEPRGPAPSSFWLRRAHSERTMARYPLGADR